MVDFFPLKLADVMTQSVLSSGSDFTRTLDAALIKEEKKNTYTSVPQHICTLSKNQDFFKPTPSFPSLRSNTGNIFCCCTNADSVMVVNNTRKVELHITDN